MNDTTFQGNGKVAYVPVVVYTQAEINRAPTIIPAEPLNEEVNE